MFYSDGKEVVKFAKKQTQESSPQRQRRSRIQVGFSWFPLRCEGDQKSKEFLPQRREDREEAEYKSVLPSLANFASSR